MFVCVYRYFLAKVEDSEIKKILQHALDLSQQHVQVVTKIFKEEGHAVPLGFTENV
jgi:rubrerythrin